jgi:excisionase family DNA binding protein
MEALITTQEAARQANTSDRMIRHYVKTGRLPVAKRSGQHMLFDPRAVAALTLQIDPVRRPRQTVHAAGLGAVGFIVPAPLQQLLVIVCVAIAVALVISGAVSVISERAADRRAAAQSDADRVPPAGMTWAEFLHAEIATAPVYVDHYRGRVYRACRGEFWRSRFDGWCYHRADRIVTVDDPIALAALEMRDRREQLSVVA